ncbi:MAG: TetR/AcrR family transcriptional regulator [Parafannyhessea sp.]|jgi:AcrR family transcriptional regulator|uniref:TetR/AcrR family transcriptional regulator n=1 Tax=Parafannyhessea sp. TaxID=2847324 RepID=UPI003F0A9868
MGKTIMHGAATGRRTPSATVDRRSARTRRALRDALAAEIQATGDLSQVTVTAVTERADVTRRTFYSHFRDIQDLVNQTEEETIADLRELVGAISSVDLEQLERAIADMEPCPGSVELLQYFKDRGLYLGALLGKGGDPAFAQRIKDMVRSVVTDRALDGLDARAMGSFFDYYLTFAVSAEVGVLVEWLTGGMRESVGVMARLMTALMFVRPGDLYGRPIDFDVPKFAIGLGLLNLKEKNDD